MNEALTEKFLALIEVFYQGGVLGSLAPTIQSQGCTYMYVGIKYALHSTHYLISSRLNEWNKYFELEKSITAHSIIRGKR